MIWVRYEELAKRISEYRTGFLPPALIKRASNFGLLKPFWTIMTLFRMPACLFTPTKSLANKLPVCELHVVYINFNGNLPPIHVIFRALALITANISALNRSFANAHDSITVPTKLSLVSGSSVNGCYFGRHHFSFFGLRSILSQHSQNYEKSRFQAEIFNDVWLRIAAV